MSEMNLDPNRPEGSRRIDIKRREPKGHNKPHLLVHPKNQWGENVIDMLETPLPLRSAADARALAKALVEAAFVIERGEV